MFGLPGRRVYYLVPAARPVGDDTRALAGIDGRSQIELGHCNGFVKGLFLVTKVTSHPTTGRIDHSHIEPGYALEQCLD